MSQSLTNISIHIIFSTKQRQPIIDEAIEDQLFNYLGGVCRELECQPIQVGGYLDHVHILTGLSKKITVVELLREVKQNSSKWIKTKGDRYACFYWQDGYAAYSVDTTQLDKVVNYIQNQKQHHQKDSFQDECRALFKKYKIEYDERYVWD